MPTRLVKLIAEHAEANRARANDRDTSRIESRLSRLLKKITPSKHQEYLLPVMGADFLCEWERYFAQQGAFIMLDELCNHMLKELPAIDAQVRAEVQAVKDLGYEGIKRIPPITLANIQKVIDELEATGAIQDQ